MPSSATNRGPAAAATNRRALVGAARRLFALHGYDVPLSAVAREAGVGQGSLYRHFPTRLDLALEIFEDNYAELERLSAEHPGPQGFEVLWRRLVAQTLESRAFVEMAVDARAQLVDRGIETRLEVLLRAPLERAQRAGRVAGHLRVDDVMLAHRMIYGAIVTAPDDVAAQESVRRAVTLLDPTLARWAAGAD